MASRPIGTCRVRNVPERHPGGVARLAYSATGHSTGSAPLTGSTVYEAGRRSSEQRGRSPPLNHSRDHAVRATLGRQGRPRRPVFRNGKPGSAKAPGVSDLVRARLESIYAGRRAVPATIERARSPRSIHPSATTSTPRSATDTISSRLKPTRRRRQGAPMRSTMAANSS